MKFRTNAQKKRIDVWLIYRCESCSETWNLPIFERMAVGDIAPDQFQAIAHNDRALATSYAFDRARLDRHGDRVEDSLDIEVRKQKLGGNEAAATMIEISLGLALPCRPRLDRLLARELGATRGRLDSLLERGALRLSPLPRKGLRSRVTGEQAVSIDLDSAAVDPELERDDFSSGDILSSGSSCGIPRA